MSLTFKREPLYTIDYIEALPDGERAELIDGVIYNMSSPSTTHQMISMELCTTIHNYIKSKAGSCRVFSAPFSVFLNKDNYNYFEPDISVICDPDKIDEKGCHGAPDWIIEISSPSTASRDYLLKLNKYHDAGVKEYWIVSPLEKTIGVYTFKNSRCRPDYYTFTDSIKVDIYTDLEIDFSQINI